MSAPAEAARRILPAPAELLARVQPQDLQLGLSLHDEGDGLYTPIV